MTLHISKLNDRTWLKFRITVVSIKNYYALKFEANPSICFWDMVFQSWSFFNILETVQYFWDRGSNNLIRLSTSLILSTKKFHLNFSHISMVFGINVTLTNFWIRTMNRWELVLSKNSKKTIYVTFVGNEIFPLKALLDGIKISLT